MSAEARVVEIKYYEVHLPDGSHLVNRSVGADGAWWLCRFWSEEEARTALAAWQTAHANVERLKETLR